MPMDSAILAVDIKARFLTKLAVSNPALTALIGEGKVDINSFIDAMSEACAEATIQHISTLATVNVTVASVGAVTPGVGVSGPGTGIGTIS